MDRLWINVYPSPFTPGAQVLIGHRSAESAKAAHKPLYRIIVREKARG